MDNVTHTLFGATLGAAVFPRAGRGTTAALVLASNAPDVDIITTAGGTLNYLQWHRGPTHGPLGVVGLAATVAGLVWLWQRLADRDRRHEHARYLALFGISIVAIAAHILMDLPTSYGTRVLSPFNWHWYAVDLMPIIDIYLLTALAVGFVVGRRRPGIRRQLALVVMAFMVLNYAVRAITHRRAVTAAAEAMAPILPPRCDVDASTSWLDRWPREDPAARRTQGATRCLVEVAAIPTFFSPFRWRIIARLSDAYQTMELNLLTDPQRPLDALDAPWRTAVPYGDQWTPSVVRAADGALGRVFLGFSRFPAVQSVVNEDRSADVRWTDLRFTNVPTRRPAAPRGMFSALVRVAPDGRIVDESLGQ